MRPITHENLIVAGMALVLVVTFLAVFTGIIYGKQDIFLLSLIAGAVILAVLITLHIRSGYRVRNAGSGLLICILIFMFFLVILGGTAYFENQPASYEYRVSVKGLDNYRGSLATDIIVPMPMRNKEQVFSDAELQYQSFGDWTSVLVVTKKGKMLAFQSNKRNLTDIEAVFRKDLDRSVDAKEIMQDALLHPISGDVAANNTIWVYGDENVQNYTTYVYLDQNMQPFNLDNYTITFDLGLTVRNGIVHGKARNIYRVDILEKIPEGVNGPLPVKAQLAVITETGWGPQYPNEK